MRLPFRRSRDQPADPGSRPAGPAAQPGQSTLLAGTDQHLSDWARLAARSHLDELALALLDQIAPAVEDLGGGNRHSRRAVYLQACGRFDEALVELDLAAQTSTDGQLTVFDQMIFDAAAAARGNDGALESLLGAADQYSETDRGLAGWFLGFVAQAAKERNDQWLSDQASSRQVQLGGPPPRPEPVVAASIIVNRDTSLPADHIDVRQALADAFGWIHSPLPIPLYPQPYLDTARELIRRHDEDGARYFLQVLDSLHPGVGRIQELLSQLGGVPEPSQAPLRDHHDHAAFESCRCRDGIDALSGCCVDFYLDRHLVVQPLPAALRAVDAAWPSYRLLVAACPQTGTAWLRTTISPEGAKYLFSTAGSR